MTTPINQISTPNYQYPSFMQQNTINSTPLAQVNADQSAFPKMNGLDYKFKSLDFIGSSTKNNPLCIRREGMLKIRDVDQKDKDVVVTFAVLTKDRLSYFVNAVFLFFF